MQHHGCMNDIISIRALDQGHRSHPYRVEVGVRRPALPLGPQRPPVEALDPIRERHAWRVAGRPGAVGISNGWPFARIVIGQQRIRPNRL